MVANYKIGFFYFKTNSKFALKPIHHKLETKNNSELTIVYIQNILNRLFTNKWQVEN